MSISNANETYNYNDTLLRCFGRLESRGIQVAGIYTELVYHPHLYEDCIVCQNNLIVEADDLLEGCERIYCVVTKDRDGEAAGYYHSKEDPIDDGSIKQFFAKIFAKKAIMEECDEITDTDSKEGN